MRSYWDGDKLEEVNHFVGQLNAIRVMEELAWLVVPDALFIIQTAVVPLTARKVEPSNILPTFTSDPSDTSYISKPLSPCQRAKFAPACSVDAGPMVFIAVGDVKGSLSSDTMTIVPRTDASSGAA